MPRLRDLGLVGGDHTADLGTFLLERLNDERIGHAALKPKSAGGTSLRWCLLHNAVLLNGQIFITLKEAQIVIEGWRHHYNGVRPHSSLGYPSMTGNGPARI